MNSDVLSPICVGALFICVLQWLRAQGASVWLGALTGLAIAATYLTKLSNLPIIAVALVVIFARLLPMIQQTPRVGLVALGAVVFCAAIPICSWMLWTKHQFGDVTGSTAKIAVLGWTWKSPAEWWHHPIFTPQGVWIFWRDLVASFWRGEVKWKGQILRWPIADGFYAISSLVMLPAAVVALQKNSDLSTFQRQAIGIAVLSFIVSVGFMGLLSIQFDFGDCINPSRARPYFTSGRLLSGALIPFALAYVYGMSNLLRRTSPRVSLIVLGLMLTFVTTSEIIINRVVFASEHNWFHR
jgi:hypothetical protein